MTRVYWDAEKNGWLMNNYFNFSIIKCSEILNCSTASIRRQANRLGLIKRKSLIVKDGNKFCYSCKTEKSIDSFNKNKAMQDGVMAKCIHCESQKRKEKRQVDPTYFWVFSTLNQHKRRGYKIEITIQELKLLASKSKKCIYCEKELSWFNNKIQHNSPTLDRINNEEFVTLDNCGICCYQCNSTKSNRTLKGFIEYMEKTLAITRQLLAKGNYGTK